MPQEIKYEILIERGLVTGQLTFQHGNVSVDTKCYWDSSMVLDAGEYVCCRTKLDKKDRPGIWFGKDVTYNNGTARGDGAFIHKYEKNPWDWSDGCIVIAQDQMATVKNAIAESDVFNIRVTVKDKKYYIPALNR